MSADPDGSNLLSPAAVPRSGSVAFSAFSDGPALPLKARSWRDPIFGGQKRMEAIRMLGLDEAEELRLIGMVNDPIVVDLFATILPSGELPENADHFKLALMSALQYCGTSVVETQAKKEEELQKAQVEWEVTATDRVSKAEKRVKEQADEEWRKMSEAVKKRHAREMQRARNETTAEARRRERQCCRRVLVLESMLGDAIQPVEDFLNLKIVEAGQENIESGEADAPPRYAPDVDAEAPPPDPDEEDDDDDTSRELRLPAPDLFAFLSDATAQLAWRLQRLLRVTGLGFRAAAIAHQRETEELQSDLEAAAAELEQKDAEYRELEEEYDELKRSLLRITASVGTQTDLLGEQLEADARELRQGRERLEKATTALEKRVRELQTSTAERDQERERRVAGEQHLADMIARLHRLREGWPYRAAQCISAVLKQVPGDFSKRLPSHAIPPAELSRPVPVLRLGHDGGSGADSSPQNCHGLTVVSLSSTDKIYDDLNRGGGRSARPCGSVLAALPPPPPVGLSYPASPARARAERGGARSADHALQVSTAQVVPIRSRPASSAGRSPFQSRRNRPLALTFHPKVRAAVPAGAFPPPAAGGGDGGLFFSTSQQPD
eukprot:TRINITY_DN4770_c0_g1_i1.p1 TRINITY_DN4770_c0_g1~~TRINITY_DN4770_c0_g1_i1.p1  ORF type:complete len:637 (+),score=258.38 TRINITY_DN4770_c0_g1_i1:83-1912(+)